MADDTRPSFGYHLVSAGSTNATSVIAKPCRLTFILCSNVNAAVRYLKIYDLAAAPTVGTDVPLLTIPLPGAAAGTGIPIPLPQGGIGLAKGLAFALTTEATDAGSTGVSASESVVNLAYQKA